MRTKRTIIYRLPGLIVNPLRLVLDGFVVIMSEHNPGGWSNTHVQPFWLDNLLSFILHWPLSIYSVTLKFSRYGNRRFPRLAERAGWFTDPVKTVDDPVHCSCSLLILILRPTAVNGKPWRCSMSNRTNTPMDSFCLYGKP